MAGKKRSVVSVVSVCEILATFKVPAVMSKRMDKRSHSWPRGKLIFAVSYFFMFACFLQLFSTALDLFWVN